MKKADIDIIGFLDVRANRDLSHTQLDELQMLVPTYKHKHFQPVRLIHKNHLKPGWELEGIGFMSRHKILTKASIDLSVPYNSSDQTKRTILYAQFYIEPEQLEVNIILIQLSNDKRTQVHIQYYMFTLLYKKQIKLYCLIKIYNYYDTLFQ